MPQVRIILVAMLITGLVAGGCGSSSLPGLVAEYHPSSPPVETKAPDSGVFILWRWVPVAPVMGDASTQPAKTEKERPIEVKEVYAEQGTPVGFRRSAGELSAFAGTTSVPVEDAHYAWTSQKAAHEQVDAPQNAGNFIVQWWFWTSVPAFIGGVVWVWIHSPAAPQQ